MIKRFFYDTEFIETEGSIDLISIGMVDEQGDKLYYCNSECDLSKANQWVQDNVIPHLSGEKLKRKDIAAKIIQFVNYEFGDEIEFWGYYSAYDHVVLCWLFGVMMDLPKGFPMYTKDIKQYADYLNVRLPTQKGIKHDALEDAKWNKESLEYLENIDCNF